MQVRGRDLHSWVDCRRLTALAPRSAVLGSQWGDEGKGKLVDILAQEYDIVARCQVLNHALGGSERNPHRLGRCM